MPGMNLICLEQGIEEQRSEITKVLDGLSGVPESAVKIFVENDSCLMASKSYPEYPLSFWENNQYGFYVEGRIYNRSQKQISDDLASIADNFFYENENTEKLVNWIYESDGDFLVWVREKKSGKLIIFNDALGRMPLYYYYENAMLLVSRDIRFITSLSHTQAYEGLAIAQYLALGHSMGNATLWSNVCHLNPGALLSFNPVKASVRQKTVCAYNFSRKKYRNRSPKQNAAHLVELFCNACSCRAGMGTADILSLSGGFDSRCIGAGLSGRGYPFLSITFFKSAYHLKKEMERARKLAELFKSPWQLVEIPELTSSHALELLRIKNGMNNLGMAFILNFFKQIKETYGSGITYFTGDGGDMTIPVPDPKPIWSVRSFKGLVEMVFDSNHFGNQCFQANDAAAIAGIKPKTLFESVAEYLTDCPETTWYEKFLHYKFCRRFPKVLAEAEDRNRYYFWSATPFYAKPFFDYAMNCPDEQKVAYDLYRRFLKMLSPKAYHVNYSGFDYSPASAKFKFKAWASQIKWLNPPLSKKIKTAVKGVNRSFSQHGNVSAILERQIKTCPAVFDNMNTTFLKHILANLENYERNQIIELFTLISAMEYLSSEQSSLETANDLILT